VIYSDLYAASKVVGLEPTQHGNSPNWENGEKVMDFMGCPFSDQNLKDTVPKS